MLAHPAARQLSSRFSTIVQAPPCERAVLETSPPAARERRMRRWAAAAGIVLALGTVGLLAGSVRDWNVSGTGPVARPTPATSAPALPAILRQDQVSRAPAVAPPPPAPAERVDPPAAAAAPPPPPPMVAVIPPPPATPPTSDAQPPTPPAPPARVASLPAPPRKPAPPAPTPPAASGEVLQLGAFRSAENAETLREQVARLYPEARVSNVTVKGVEYHRVRLGASSERDLAVRAAALRAAGFAAVRVRN
jgi:cell division protein FtsN